MICIIFAPGLLWCWNWALVLELVDKRDLKSLGQKCPYGFDPRPEHPKSLLII